MYVSKSFSLCLLKVDSGNKLVPYLHYKDEMKDKSLQEKKKKKPLQILRSIVLDVVFPQKRLLAGLGFLKGLSSNICKGCNNLGNERHVLSLFVDFDVMMRNTSQS